MSSALVTGATGMNGGAIIHHLMKDPSYNKVYSLSRRDPGYQTPKVQHVTMDLQSSVEDMVHNLDGVSAEYIYFCAYLARADETELLRVNVTLLRNFLQALKATGADKNIKRFILTCGFKQYGVHLGQNKQPSWKMIPEFATNSDWEWIVTLPEDVLGKALPGSELPYPGSKANYFAFNCWTSANLHAKFCLWAARAPAAGNNIFNVMNGDTESFQNLWPRLAARFGCRIPDPMFPNGGVPNTKGFKDYESTTIPLKNRPPIQACASSLGLSSDALVKETPTLFLQVDPVKWARRGDVNEAWAGLRDKYHLDQQAWAKATWDFLVLTMGRDWSCVASMSKARKLGWSRYADTWEELDTFRMLEDTGVLPPVDQLRRDFSL
ncbi:hypothetical protein PENDEC_c013G00137 [Penicillium decumbens]|uniref:NAD-dependent epimerase/dehydratase domain-containing protein n=1 Tax=Penicillium decumbens TaxID=69771 RepID=A0A1V6PBB0_PENDC|nr:hypothetical protein PENDEC_c013G00137 [Penicillium decumbens]